ncbi:Tetratricopeptide repeat protein [Maioricimonas rarisocia]|uniref:Tetratricopeptide repeat protein n=1 Tax=Maioricimonas rarisocia TaxID=2528026 RepID=A0A517Z0W0_9PLAN|nr:tetratricopeptide repeat protein [Maioricimonas rarisocia]QDU36112.1 Tetratricopeptide repeat protein [Maioricimonas rarisocia]
MRILDKKRALHSTFRSALMLLGCISLVTPATAWSQPASERPDAPEPTVSSPADSPRLQHRHATQLYREGKVVEARQLWDEAAARDPNLPPADLAVAFEYLAQRNVAAARVAIDTAAERHSESSLLWIARARLAVGERGLGTARAALHKAHELAPGLYITNLWLGQFYEEQGALTEAARYYEAAASADSQRSEALLGIARLQFRSLDLDQTLKTLQRVAEIDPALPAESRLAALHLDAGDLPGALMWQERAVSRQPENPQSLIALARLLLRLSQFDAARETIERIPGWEDDLTSLLLRAQVEDDDNQVEQATALYRNVIAIDPNNVIAQNNLAMLLLEADQTEEDAYEAASHALTLAPGNPAVRATHACALQAIGHKDAATALLRSVHEVPADPWIRYFYGQLLVGQNKHAAAREQLRACLLLEPDFARKSDVETLLESLTESTTSAN